jgi:hypothetical protein
MVQFRYQSFVFVSSLVLIRLQGRIGLRSVSMRTFHNTIQVHTMLVGNYKAYSGIL